MIFSIELSEEEKDLADNFAKFHSMSTGEAFKQALFEKIEEEGDVAIFEEAYKEYEQKGKRSKPIESLWEELGL